MCVSRSVMSLHACDDFYPTRVMILDLQMFVKCDHNKKHNKTDSVAVPELFQNLRRDPCDLLAHPEQASLGQQQERPLALLGWLTACDVSHFRLDSTEHGAPPYFSPSSLSNPV